MVSDGIEMGDRGGNVRPCKIEDKEWHTSIGASHILSDDEEGIVQRWHE